MHPRTLSPLALLLSGSFCFAAPPVVPGLHGKHPLDDVQSGKLLIGELRCASCHDGMEDKDMKEAPDLSNAGARLTLDYMEKFIADPAAVHHGTTMPNVLAAETPEKRAAIAADIAAYLSSLKNGPEPTFPEGEIDPYDGKELFHSAGCVACHSPRDEAYREVLKEGVVSLGHLPGKHLPAALGDFLHTPLEIRPSGRMPDMKLTKMEAHTLAAYLEGENKSKAAPPAEASRIEAGRKAFEAHNCTACHQPEKDKHAAPLAAKPLSALDLTSGCLSEKPAKAPDFHLSAAQKTSIRAALAKPAALTAPERVNTHLTRMNCIACHVRDDFGGVSPKLDDFFHSTEESLGNDSRIPPPLTLTGAKLRPEWMKKVLYDGASVRPYMKTRMPQFGKAGLSDLADLFAEVDKMEPVIELAPPGREEQPQMRDGAHDLLGDQGLNCIACHNYNGKESPGMKGIDLMTSYERLQPTWFHQYMINPAKFRPGIIMPSYWPDGKAVRTDILDGDTDRQLRALWDNFSLGRSARDPSGLRNEPAKLTVTDKTLTYRGRSGAVAGYRGIAVGFPGGMSYAFNAEYGSLSAIWQGEFVRVNWQGQGAGDFAPLSPHIQLSQDVAFLAGKEPLSPWPARPIVTKEAPVNPDPLYPRNHGYAFLGYSLDVETSIPTFRYRCGETLIEDTTKATEKSLERTFAFTAPAAETLWLRALTGEIKAVSETVYETADLRITIPTKNATLRPIASGGMELLLKITLPEGKSNAILRYELLR